nr:cell division topological specificity factor MinE [uncultured Blautia sp.]
MRSFLQIKNRSAEYARNRMKSLLVSERIDCSPQMMKLLKDDMIRTVKKYVSIDEEGVVFQVSQEPPMIHADIPVFHKR